MLGSYNIILVVARIYPLIVQIISFLIYFINLDKDFLILGITMVLSEIINGGLKNLVCKPLIGNKKYIDIIHAVMEETNLSMADTIFQTMKEKHDEIESKKRSRKLIGV